MIVTEARVNRATDWDGRPCAEIEAQTSDWQITDLLAYFGPHRGDDYDLLAVVDKRYRIGARVGVSLYGGDAALPPQLVQQADMTDELFDTPTMKSGRGERDDFKAQVLSYPGIRAEIRRLMDGSRPWQRQ